MTFMRSPPIQVAFIIWCQLVVTMRSSMKLAFIALLSRVAYGFSNPTATPRTPTRRFEVQKTSTFLSTRPRGGATKLSASPASTGSKCPATGAATIAASIWGTGGVLYILAKAVKRVLPIAMEPFQKGAVPLSKVELGYVAGWASDLVCGFVEKRIQLILVQHPSPFLLSRRRIR